jgi:nucleoid-associated protein YgaU
MRAAAARLALVLGALAGCDAAPSGVHRASDVAPLPTSLPAAPRAAAEQPCETRSREPATTWRVRRGDTIAEVARRVYGDERFGAEIVRLNPGRVGRRGELAPGTDLALPRDVR